MSHPDPSFRKSLALVDSEEITTFKELVSTSLYCLFIQLSVPLLIFPMDASFNHEFLVLPAALEVATSQWLEWEKFIVMAIFYYQERFNNINYNPLFMNFALKGFNGLLTGTVLHKLLSAPPFEFLNPGFHNGVIIVVHSSSKLSVKNKKIEQTC